MFAAAYEWAIAHGGPEALPVRETCAPPKSLPPPSSCGTKANC
jgi:hypothetical protein